MRFLSIILICLAQTIAFAEDVAPITDLNDNDKALMDQTIDKSLGKAAHDYENYLSDLEVAKKKVLKDLDTLGAQALKAGDLPLANAIVEKKKALLASTNALNDYVVAGVSEQYTITVVGKWKCGDFTYELTNKNKVINPWNENWEWSQVNNQIIIVKIGAQNTTKYVLNIKNNNSLEGKFVEKDNTDVNFDRIK